jgi:hypothetical protein
MFTIKSVLNRLAQGNVRGQIDGIRPLATSVPGRQIARMKSLVDEVFMVPALMQ